jgi:hypothetical protein
MKSLAVIGLLLVGGCNSSVSTKGIVGTYDVMISLNGKSDADIMTISPGRDGTVLFTFIAGITTDPNGPNPDGLRGSAEEGNAFKLNRQPAHILHSTGELSGFVTGEGKVSTAGEVTMTLHYSPTNLVFAPPDAGSQIPDGGIRPVDGGATTTIDYTIAGMREM